jgi:hypothetical protein
MSLPPQLSRRCVRRTGDDDSGVQRSCDFSSSTTSVPAGVVAPALCSYVSRLVYFRVLLAEMLKLGEDMQPCQLAWCGGGSEPTATPSHSCSCICRVRPQDPMGTGERAHSELGFLRETFQVEVDLANKRPQCSDSQAPSWFGGEKGGTGKQLSTGDGVCLKRSGLLRGTDFA